MIEKMQLVTRNRESDTTRNPRLQLPLKQKNKVSEKCAFKN